MAKMSRKQLSPQNFVKVILAETVCHCKERSEPKPRAKILSGAKEQQRSCEGDEAIPI